MWCSVENTGSTLAQAFTFFESVSDLTLGDIAEATGCILSDATYASRTIRSVAPIEAATSGSLTFIDNPKYVSALANTQAGAVICGLRYVDSVPDGVVALESKSPYKSFALAMGMMFPSAMRPQPLVSAGVSSNAHIDADAVIEEGVTIEPGAVVGPGAHIGTGSLIGPNAVIGTGVQVGRNTSISAGVTVSHAIIGDDVILHSGVRIGCDGFGFAMGPGGHLKIPRLAGLLSRTRLKLVPIVVWTVDPIVIRSLVKAQKSTISSWSLIMWS